MMVGRRARGLGFTKLFAKDRRAAFAKDEEGVFVVLSLFLILMTFIIVGIAVDMSRHESLRVRLQGTTDRAVLAAADLNNVMAADEVVYQYFDKAGAQYGFSRADVTVNFSKTAIASQVTANANKPIKTWFMPLSGVTQIPTRANGTAQQGVLKNEVSVVLDISTSMRSNQVCVTAGCGSGGPKEERLAALKKAGMAFVDIVYGYDGTGTAVHESVQASSDYDVTQVASTSVSFITYGMGVNIGPILDKFNVTASPTGAEAKLNCVDFTAADFGTLVTPASTDPAWKRATFFDFYTDFEQIATTTAAASIANSNGTTINTAVTDAKSVSDPYIDLNSTAADKLYKVDTGGVSDSGLLMPCPPQNAFRSLIMSNNPERQKAFLSAIDVTNGFPYNNTSIDIGMKWGTVFLHPSARDEVTAMIGDSANATAGIHQINASMTGRPGNFTTPSMPVDQQTLKYLILMTDGVGTWDVQMLDPYRSGPSMIYADNARLNLATKIVVAFGETTGIGDADGVNSETHYIVKHSDSSISTDVTKWVKDNTASTTDNYDKAMAGLTQLTWQQVWANNRLNYVAWAVLSPMLARNSATAPTLAARANKFYDLVGRPTSGVSARGNAFNLVKDHLNNNASGTGLQYQGLVEWQVFTDKDNRLQSICTEAKLARITVYTIAFANTVGSLGDLQMSACANDPTFYYNVQSTSELTAVFSSIASDIGLLRLTN